jgi:uncharacterized protein (DUF2252 family)
LENIRNSKMARSPHAYVRGNTVRYYEWLERVEPEAADGGPGAALGPDQGLRITCCSAS